MTFRFVRNMTKTFKRQSNDSNGMSQLEYAPLKSIYASDRTAGVELIQRYEEFVLSSENNSGIDDKETRTALWNLLFGSIAMPKQENDAVKKYAGALGKDLEVSESELLNALRKAKEK